MNGPVQLAGVNPFVAIGACVLLPGAVLASAILLCGTFLKRRGRGAKYHVRVAFASVAVWLVCVAVFRLLGPSAGGIIRVSVISCVSMAGFGAGVEGLQHPDEPKVPLALLTCLNALVMLVTMVTVFQLAHR